MVNEGHNARRNLKHCAGFARTLRASTLLPAAATALWLAPGPALGREGPLTAGFIEEASIGEAGVRLEAKLDTGAETSSLHAEGLEVSTAGGGEVARFSLRARDGTAQHLELPVARWVRIRRAGTETERRPVVRLPLCLAGATAVTEFTLTDRTGLDYAVLVGRAFLAGRILVDAARTHSASEACPAVRGEQAGDPPPASWKSR